MELHRQTGECPGHWVRSPARPCMEWRCTHCGAAYSGDDIAAREAIWREYEMELIFFRLSAEGRLLLSVQRNGRAAATGEGG